MDICEKLPSRLESIPEFTSLLIERLSRLPITEEEIFNIKLSLQEALVNAIKHGNKLNPSLSAEVNIKIEDDRLIIEVRDQGNGFDFKNIPDPTTQDNLERVTGRGIFLIKNLMDLERPLVFTKVKEITKSLLCVLPQQPAVGL